MNYSQQELKFSLLINSNSNDLFVGLNPRIIEEHNS